MYDKVVESIIADEKSKNHHVFAKQIKEASIDKLNSLTLLDRSNSNGAVAEQVVEQFLMNLQPRKTLSDLILRDNVLKLVNEFIREQQRTDLLRSYGLEPRNRLLFVGSPGNGKTSLAEAIATGLMLPFFVIRYDGIIGSYLGETATRLRRMFEFIRTRHCILFLDEFDSLGKERGDEHETGEIKRVVSSLLFQIDSLPSYVIAIAATNHPELLDRAVWRRFQIRIELQKPSHAMTLTYLKRFEEELGQKLQPTPKGLADVLRERSFSEIEDFCMDVKRRYVLSLPDANVKNAIKTVLMEHQTRYSLHARKASAHISKA